MSVSRKREAGQVPVPRGERVVIAFDRRLSVVKGGKLFLRKAFPDHWSFLLGELALYSFAVLVLTGVYLTFYFHNGMQERPYGGSYVPLRGVLVSDAYNSVMHISFDVRGGLLVRQMHHWAALLFVGAICVHLLRIFFTGAFRRPREANWVVGVTMLMLAMLEGFCGYSLPDDLLSGTGLRTAQGIMLSIPVVGTYASFLVFGGQFPGHEIIPRLYAFHILLLPGLLTALVTVHLALVVHLKHTQWAKPGRTNRNVVGKPLFPQYTAKSTGLFLMVSGLLAALGALMQINPIWDTGPYRADQASTDAQPDWYVGFLEGGLRLMPGAETRLWGHTISWNPLLPGVVLPTLVFAVLYVYPFFERWLSGDTGERHLLDRPRDQPVRTGLGVAGVCVYAVLLLAGAQDVLAYVFAWPVEWLAYILRTALFVLPVTAYWMTARLCLWLQRRDRRMLTEGRPASRVRPASGGYVRVTRPLSGQEAYGMVVRHSPVARTAGTEPWKFLRRHRLRNLLSAWYFADRHALMPVTPRWQQQIDSTVGQPGHGGPPEG